jgi:hypothetical protein
MSFEIEQQADSPEFGFREYRRDDPLAGCEVVDAKRWHDNVGLYGPNGFSRSIDIPRLPIEETIGKLELKPDDLWIRVDEHVDGRIFYDKTPDGKRGRFMFFQAYADTFSYWIDAIVQSKDDLLAAGVNLEGLLPSEYYMTDRSGKLRTFDPKTDRVLITKPIVPSEV